MKAVQKAKITLLSSMALFGTIGIFVRYIPLPSSLIALVRGTVGMLFLLFLLRVKGTSLSKDAIRRNLLVLGLSGAFIGFNWVLLFEAYRYTTVATATLCYYFQPIIVILASPFVLRERLTGKKIICVFIALIGMVFVSGVAETGFAKISEMQGVLYGLGAAVFYACVILLNQKLRDISTYDRTVMQLGIAALVMLPYVLLTEDLSSLTLSPLALVLLLIVGVVHTGITYALYFGSMKDLSAQTVAIFSYVDPIVAILLSALVLHESMEILEIIGAVLVLGSTLISELPDRKANS